MQTVRTEEQSSEHHYARLLFLLWFLGSINKRLLTNSPMLIHCEVDRPLATPLTKSPLANSSAKRDTA